MKFRIFIILLLCFSFFIKAQTDNEFWFAAPDVSSQHSCGPNPPNNFNGTPISMYVTAEQATTVTIDLPADTSFNAITFTLNAGEHRKVNLVAPYNPSRFENYTMEWPLAVGHTVQKKGIHIVSSPGNITAYYELNNQCNRDIFALKGKNALGKDFYVSTQNYFPNGAYGGTAFSGFVIVATEDSTVINVNRNGIWQNFTSAPPQTITLVLNKGETFAFIANSTAAANHINGVHVTSNKNIAITWYDDSIRKTHPTGTSYDICGDQTIPINLIGKNYIVMKGEIYVGADGGERFFVTATKNNTAVYVNGNLRTTLSTGQVYSEEVIGATMRVSCSEPVYVNHVSGTGGGGEMGGATLPTIDGCTGSHKVTITRTNVAGDAFLLTLMVRNATSGILKNKSIENCRIIIGIDTFKFDKSYFGFLPDSSWAYLKNEAAARAFVNSKITPGTSASIYNPIALFHLGVQNGGTSNGGKYGYFSDYSTNRGRAGIGGSKGQAKENYCNLDPILFAVEGGIKYKWFGAINANDTIYLNSTTNNEVYFSPPQPATGVTATLYKFGVIITRECFADTTIYLQARVIMGPVADFDISNPIGCSPYDPIFTNKTDTAYAKKMWWNFNAINNSDTLPQTMLPFPVFNHLFPENNSDTLQYYRVQLVAWADFGSCKSEREKIITIKPGAKADFSVAGDTSGCSPLKVNFVNNSIGHIDSSGYYWDFGDHTQSFEESPSHTYLNYGNKDSIYTATLIVSTPFGCTDTVNQDFVVYPYIKAALAVDTAFSCSPMSTSLKVNNSVGVDTFKWSINYSDHISILKRINYSPLPISHVDTSVAYPDTIKINLIAKNRFGCADTVPERRIVVIPRVKADFDIDTTVVCDSVRINFINTSSAYKPRYYLSFGDGVSALDSVKRIISHSYYNRTNSDVVYSAKLITTSNDLCPDTKDTSITVHPYIDGNFAVQFENNCSPIDVVISNLSTRVHSFDWDFGDNSAHDVSSAPFIYHQYKNPLADRDTTYKIKLNVTSQEGCKDSSQVSILIYPQVVAKFTMSDSINCNPLKIDFTNQSTGKNLFYNWKFGKELSGSESASTFQRTFNHYANHDSSFSVTLKAMNSYGCDSSISKPVTIYAYIKSDFNMERADSCSPFTIKLSNKSPAGATSYKWIFDDNSQESNLFEPTYTYKNTNIISPSATYDLTLIVKNNHSCYDTFIRPVVVYPEIKADFSLDKLSDCQPLTVNIKNDFLFPTVIDYYWTFDDGSFSTSEDAIISHTYTNDKSYSVERTIKLYAETQRGCSDDTSQKITVFPFIHARFSTTKSGVCTDEPFNIDRSASFGGIEKYQWDFEDDGNIDSTISDPIFKKSFFNFTQSDKIKTIRLTVLNEQGCDTSWVQNVTVYPDVTADFTVGESEICYPMESQIRNDCPWKDIVETKFYWDFGDGNVSNEANPVVNHQFRNFEYDSDKKYFVTLIAESDHACRDTIIDSIIVHPKPKADFDFDIDVSADCPPFMVPFHNYSRGTNLSYEWNFGDGANIESGTNPSHEYHNDGYDILERTIQLISTTEFLCQDTVTKPINIYPQVNVNFTASPFRGCSPLTVDFTGSAVNQNSLFWYIDGSAFSTLEKPAYRFVNNTPDSMVFDIKFKATSLYNCKAETTKQVTVYPTPVAEFIPDPVLQHFNTETDISPVTIKNYTPHQNSGTWEYSWNYGNGDNDSNEEGVFIKEYKQWGDIHNGSKIPISLFVKNKDNPECTDSVMHEVIIIPPIPQIDIADDITGCAPLTIDFSSTTKYIYSDSYLWDFGTNNETSTTAEPEFTYTEPATYIVKLIVEGDGGLNWDYKKITVFSNPEVDFDFSPDLVMEETHTEPATPVKFFNNTRLGNEYVWDLGDGSPYTTEKEPVHVYADTGHYYITLIATSVEGCMDTLTHPKPVIVAGARLLKFPTAIIIDASAPEDEYYDPTDATNPAIFRPVARGIEKYKLEIYNRWGELIFLSEDVNRGWNGFIDGEPVKQDVYVWRATATFSDGKPTVIAGDLTLMVR